MEAEFNLEKYFADGIKMNVAKTLKLTFKDPKEPAFLAKYAVAAKKASELRRQYEEQGIHIPPFLICSITTQCNLHCAGCYSRANNATVDGAPVDQLSAEEWDRVFREARDLGVGFIMLAGGEPTVRRDVIERAADYPEIIFPIFTNGTTMDKGYRALVNAHRNLIPVFSMEGLQLKTDERRGAGVFAKVTDNMAAMDREHLPFGVSLTQTRFNREEITGDEFISRLNDLGTRLVFYIEYVPATRGTESLAPNDEDRERMKARLSELRRDYPEMIFIAFPGDEKVTGGCLAAGRGFFHINAHGGAEPCPFSPYSDSSVRSSSLLEVLQSRLFTELQRQALMDDGHDGGCVLYNKREQVEAILRQ